MKNTFEYVDQSVGILLNLKNKKIIKNNEPKSYFINLLLKAINPSIHAFMSFL